MAATQTSCRVRANTWPSVALSVVSRTQRPLATSSLKTPFVASIHMSGAPSPWMERGVPSAGDAGTFSKVSVSRLILIVDLPTAAQRVFESAR